MRDYFDELNDNVNLLSDVANDMISLFSNEGLAQIKIEKYRKCKRICKIFADAEWNNVHSGFCKRRRVHCF